ncbi:MULTISPECIES: ABC-ATPase domain-containing protein [Photobacterium]|uniref:Isopentenyl-diphosphate delta-isomerase n=1 Tax=Photobacterium ganghwense TaxID=320778 RepID=A0A0J1HFB2_9GAMM|nr:MULTISPECIES: ABC-ATPase domain-containing protein [Photobacterium]KLV10301.1 isopentenyl-diphosphate delta-isomerase [Photobacterium ganghwense]PSU09812.1 isopentenyl-diphosphate delta-isomerase [Photobacterium ganghwense]QSV17058.1 ABC-ATPase domain-containing protein [Photobacterium ganghwense]
MQLLEAKLHKIDRHNYRSYSSLRGEYHFVDFDFFIDITQADPYAPASRVRARRKWSLTDLEWLKEQSPDYQRAARDFIARQFAELAQQINEIQIDRPGQCIIDRTAVVFDDDALELRFRVDLPSDGRTIIAKKTLNLLTFTLPKIIRRATIARELPMEALKRHCETVEDQVALRKQLSDKGLMAFVADDSILPRLAGNSELPMPDAIPFVSPESLAVELVAPHRGKIRGMGVPKGITMIVGGGFHGKSTLLNAIESSVYDHIPGDGREYIVTDESATKIRAEDGRCVHQVDLTPYISNLPMGKDTSMFSTQNASGSTSQAAWLQESIESGANALLIDEDTSASNFMIRDERMQALIAKNDEPITPLVDRISLLRDQLGISVLLVMGGSGDYLDVADTVIQMHNYQALDVTEKAKAVIAEHPTRRQLEGSSEITRPRTRQLNRVAMKALLEDGKFRIQVKDKSSLRFGREYVDLQALEQVADSSQLHAVGWLWFQIAQNKGWEKNPSKAFETMLADDNWFRTMPNYGDIAKPRVIEVMAVLNRMRKAEFK